MIAASHQPQFVPYLGFFHKISRCDLLIVLDDVQFMERGHQHRNQIKMQTGTQWLTVPVRQKRGQLIHEVQIDGADTRWRKKHWAALVSNYSPSPFWKQLSPSLQPILLEGTQTRLIDLDLDLLRWVNAQLGLEVAMRLSSELGGSGDANERHIHLCKAVGAEVYYSGPGAKAYLDVAKFAAAGIEIRFQDYTGKPYAQCFSKLGFIPNLSVLDALFNLGPQARALISS